MPFDHEKLRVCQEAILFVGWADELCGALSRKGSVAEQLDRAATSVALNIAEGNGKYLPNDRSRHFDIARGSALECDSCLDVLVAKNRSSAVEVAPGKQMLANIASMLVGRIESTSTNRFQAGRADYSTDADSITITRNDQDHEDGAQ